MTKARDIADGVDTADIADGAISTAKLADGSISTAKIANNSINATKLDVSGNGTAGQVLKSDGDGSFTWVDTADPFSPTTVSGATPSLDLGTYNFFAQQGALSANTTLSFANVPTAKRWSYDVTQGDGAAGDLLAATTSQFAVSASGGYANITEEAVALGNSGAKVFVAGQDTTNSTWKFFEFNLSTPYTPSTGTLNQSIAIPSASGMTGYPNFEPAGMIFNSTGTKLIALARSTQTNVADRLCEFTLSTGWDISTLTHTQNYILSSASSVGARSRSLTSSPDGTKLYYSQYNDQKFTQVNLPTGFSLTGASVTNFSQTNTSSYNITKLAISYDGTSLVAGSDLYGFNWNFTLSTAFDISTASFTGGGVTSQFVSGRAMSSTNSEDGKYVILLDSSNTMYVYKSVTPYTLTLPASVQNSDYLGTLSANDRYLLEFVTTDSGANIWLVGKTLYDNN